MSNNSSPVTVSIFGALSEVLSQTTESSNLPNSNVKSTSSSSSTSPRNSASTTTTSTTTTTTTTTTTLSPISVIQDYKLKVLSNYSEVSNSSITSTTTTTTTTLSSPLSNESSIINSAENIFALNATNSVNIINDHQFNNNQNNNNNNNSNQNHEINNEIPIVMLRSVNTNSGIQFNITSQKVLPSLLIPTILSAIPMEEAIETRTQLMNDSTSTLTYSYYVDTTTEIDNNMTNNITEINNTDLIINTTDTYTPRFESRLPKLLPSMTNTQTQPTSDGLISRGRKDFIVFGLLPNNSVAVKYPSEESDEEMDSNAGRFVYAILSNNTVIRRYPNGTTKAVNKARNIQITDFEPSQLWDPNSDLHKSVKSMHQVKPTEMVLLNIPSFFVVLVYSFVFFCY